MAYLGRGSDDVYCSAYPAEGHHWVSHSVDAPPLHWVIRCSLCGRIDQASLRRELRQEDGWQGHAPGVRFRFVWTRPRLAIVSSARDWYIPCLVANTYPGAWIGLALYWRRRGISLLWGRPGKAR